MSDRVFNLRLLGRFAIAFAIVPIIYLGLMNLLLAGHAEGSIAEIGSLVRMFHAGDYLMLALVLGPLPVVVFVTLFGVRFRRESDSERSEATQPRRSLCKSIGLAMVKVGVWSLATMILGAMVAVGLFALWVELMGMNPDAIVASGMVMGVSLMWFYITMMIVGLLAMLLIHIGATLLGYWWIWLT